MRTKTRYLAIGAALFALGFVALDVPALGVLLGAVGGLMASLLGLAYEAQERQVKRLEQLASPGADRPTA